jgi:transposase-like protein
VKLVVSDAHEGLKAAIAAVLPGASWQRCRTHFMRNLLTRVPRASQSLVATLVRSIFEQPDATEVWEQHARVVDLWRNGSRLPPSCSSTPATTFTAFPKEYWKQIRSNNPQERLNKELRRRTDVVGISPTGPPSSVSSAPSSANNTTNGPSPAATCPQNPCSKPKGMATT